MFRSTAGEQPTGARLPMSSSARDVPGSRVFPQGRQTRIAPRHVACDFTARPAAAAGETGGPYRRTHSREITLLPGAADAPRV